MGTPEHIVCLEIIANAEMAINAKVGVLVKYITTASLETRVLRPPGHPVN